MTHDVIVLLSALGVAGQVIAAALLLVAVLALFGVRGPLRGVCRAVEGYELWLAFVGRDRDGGQPLLLRDRALRPV
jgi:hypothetical protein